MLIVFKMQSWKRHKTLPLKYTLSQLLHPIFSSGYTDLAREENINCLASPGQSSCIGVFLFVFLLMVFFFVACFFVFRLLNHAGQF